MERNLEEQERAKIAFREKARVVVLTGSGVSKESGVPTFRGTNGLWKEFRAQELATPEAFNRNPALVWDFYEFRRAVVSRAVPNPPHVALAALEARVPHFCLITQNVDGLHARAGSKNILELHGSLFRVRCLGCGVLEESFAVPIAQKLPPLCHHCGGLLRPDVVWFGEPLPAGVMNQAFEEAGQCEVMLVVGTSGLVFPAAGLPGLAKDAGAFLIEINPESTPLSPMADVCLRGPAASVLPRLLQEP
jgi:NAD-dependent deacetylase